MYIRKVIKREFTEKEINIVIKELDKNKMIIDYEVAVGRTMAKMYVMEKAKHVGLFDRLEASYFQKKRCLNSEK